MHDSFGDGWNGAWAEMMVNGESVGTMSLSEGSYESTYVGVNAECTADNDGGSSTPSLVSETEPAWSFDVWPNPGTSSLNIQAQGIRAGTPLALVVLNAQGQRVASQALPVAVNGQATVIETDGWAQGVYIVRLSQQHHAAQRRWIKLTEDQRPIEPVYKRRPVEVALLHAFENPVIHCWSKSNTTSSPPPRVLGKPAQIPSTSPGSSA